MSNPVICNYEVIGSLTGPGTSGMYSNQHDPQMSAKVNPWRNRLKAIRVFLPGIILVLLLFILFINLEQGRDVVRQAVNDRIQLVLFGYAAIFLSYVSWYGARLQAHQNLN